MSETIASILLIALFGETFNFLFGMVPYVFSDCSFKGLSDFEDEHKPLVLWGGMIYWVLKLISYPLLISHRRSIKKKEVIKEKQDKLIKRTDDIYGYYSSPVYRIKSKIEELEKSINRDLYSRACDSYKDLMTILIKCSDGEGNIDTYEFSSIIKESVQECKEVVEVAYEEHMDRLKQANKLDCDSKKEDIKKTLEAMKNKNKEFKDMWRKK